MDLSLEEFIFRFRYPIVVLLVGLLFLGGGAFLWRAGVFEGTKVEVIEGGQARLAEDDESRRVVVEISGAVQKPGVYELLASDRVERLLIASGGLSAEADRSWVEKNLNRAAKLIDGQKIYIPSELEVRGGMWEAGGGSGIVGGTSTGLININTATASELDSLWGIGPARAQAIIDGRPYSSAEELLSQKIIPSNVFERIRDEITAP